MHLNGDVSLWQCENTKHLPSECTLIFLILVLLVFYSACHSLCFNLWAHPALIRHY